MLTDAITHEAEETMNRFRLYLEEYFAGHGAQSQRQVALKAGISHVHLNRIIRGHAEPTLPIAERIASATGSTLARVLKKSQNRELVSA